MSEGWDQISFWHERIVACAGRKSYKTPVQAAVYDCTDAHEEVIRARNRQALMPHVQIGMRVLDVCCGFGAVRGLLPFDVTYIGFDLVPEFIEEARRIYGGLKEKTSFQCGTAQDVLALFPDNSFDLAIGREIGSVADRFNADIMRVSKKLVLLSTSLCHASEVIER